MATSAPEAEQETQDPSAETRAAEVKAGRSKAQILAEQAANPADDPDVILEIQAFAPKRPKIVVRTNPDDESEFKIVELHMMKEWGVATQYQSKEDGARFQQLWDKSGLTSSEQKEMKVVLDRLYVRIIVTSKDFTAKERDKLDDDGRQAVVTAFTYAPQLMEARRTQASQIRDELEEEQDPDEVDSTTET